MAGDAGEKTEAPTGKRRGEARKRGQVPKSADLSQMVVLFGLILTLHGMLSHGGEVIKGYFLSIYEHLDTAHLTQRTVMLDSGQLFWTLVRAAGPMVVA